MSARDPLSPLWEDCKVCGGDHWTKDHLTPTEPGTPQTAAGREGLRRLADFDKGYAMGHAEGIRMARAARDAEIRALRDLLGDISSHCHGSYTHDPDDDCWQRVSAILDADTPS